VTGRRQTLLLIGQAMVGRRFVQAAIERALTQRWDVVVFAEEPRAAYDRVGLTSFLQVGADESSLLPAAREYDDPCVRRVLDHAVTPTERDARAVTAASGQVVAHDALAVHIGGDQDQRCATRDDEDKLARFVSVNSARGTPDPSISLVTGRGQTRAQAPGESAKPVSTSSPLIPLRAPP
jgi:hypothetical protein